jgi:hypothetical protein
MAATHPANITVPIMAYSSPQPEPTTAQPPQYSESFETSLAERTLSTATHASSTGRPITSPHHSHPSTRPLPIDDARRQHALPSTTHLRLTEPGGSIYGGPGPSKEELRAEAQEMVEKHGFRSEKEFNAFIDKQVEENKAEAIARAARRLDAIKRNERVDEEIRMLEMEHQMEKRAMEKRARG